MTGEKTDMNPERDSALMILESDSLLLVEDNDSDILVPETDSNLLVPESDPTRVNSNGAEPRNGHVRRFSTGNLGIPYKSVKILSRYLAASTGSCHDNCKYGMRLDAETKTIFSPRLETVVEKQGQQIGKASTLPERKKNLAVSFTSSAGLKMERSDNSVVSKKEILPLAKKESVLLKQFSLPFNGSSPKPKPLLSKSKSSSLPMKKEHSSGKENGGIQVSKEMDAFLGNSPRISISGEQTKLRRTKEKLDEKNVSARRSFSALHSVKKVLTRPIVSVSGKLPEKRVSSVTTGFKRLKGISHLKNLNGIRKVQLEQASNKGTSEKSLSATESNAESKSVRQIQNSDYSKSRSSMSENKRLSNARKRISPLQMSPPSAEKILERTRNGNHANPSPKSSENVNLRRTKHGTRVLQSSPSSLTYPKSSRESIISEQIQINNENKAASAKAESSPTPRKEREAIKKDETKMLSSRTGKVVELQPEISTPKKLKFRRRFHSDSQIDLVETAEIKLKNRAIIDDVETSTENSECEKVVLKHKDVDEKKAVQSSLNNVIEETASKLAETRKSKVKALVGAFETVISLQDARPATTVNA